MTTSELISYIRKQIKNNISKEIIVSKLILAGWHQEDIDEGFYYIEQESKKVIQEVKKIQEAGDQYREPIKQENVTEVKIEQPKIQALNKEEPKNKTPDVEVFNMELPVGEYSQKEIQPKESPKIWTPMRAPVKEQTKIDIKVETTKTTIKDPVLQEEGDKPIKEIENLDKKLDIINPKYFNKNEELIPNLTPKIKVDSLSPINTEHITQNNNASIPVSVTEPVKKSFMNNLPQSAMLSSYESDLLSVNKTREEVLKKDGGYRTIKWVIFSMILVVIIFAWLFASGLINIKNWNIPFIKEDPKVLLLNNSKVLASLKSYKTETNIEISSPSFANISAGLSSGEAVTSQDKDSVSIKTLGIINQENNNLFSDNSITVSSSILKDSINADIKNNGTDLFIKMDNPSQIIDGSDSNQTTVKINKNQFSLLPPLFSSVFEEQLNKVNIYNLLSSGMSSFINNDTLGAYNEFINNVEILEKGQESIKGIDTYHYSINPDRQLSKKLLSKISDNFVLNLSDQDKIRLTEILGSATVNSFEVWIGKGDNNIYQYNVVLDIPLSKIIDFQDKSIGNNLVNIVWKTTYYDFNISNDVSIPESYTSIVDFVNQVKKTKLKKDVSSFKQLATSLNNAEGVFGSKSNSTGSCMSPVSGSLFSPNGHTKGATTAVSSVSELLNKIMGITNGVGFCYSNPKAWSFTVPISNNYDQFSATVSEYESFYCIDNTGTSVDLQAAPKGVVCK